MPQVNAAIWLVGLQSILAPAGKLSPKRTLSKDICHFSKKKEASLLCHWLLCWIFDRHPGSEQMELTTLLEAKRDAGKLFRSSWVPLGENKRERVHHGHPPTRLSWLYIHVELNRVSYSNNLNEATIWRVSCKSWTSQSKFGSKLRRTVFQAIHPLSTLVSWSSTPFFD